jgi:hypothetical protein
MLKADSKERIKAFEILTHPYLTGRGDELANEK